MGSLSRAPLRMGSCQEYAQAVAAWFVKHAGFPEDLDIWLKAGGDGWI